MQVQNSLILPPPQKKKKKNLLWILMLITGLSKKEILTYNRVVGNNKISKQNHHANKLLTQKGIYGAKKIWGGGGGGLL